MHSLLKRQLRRFFGSADSIPDEWGDFISAVDEAYRQFDDDREMLERSMELSSQELLQANSEIRAFFTAIPDIFIRLDDRDRITFFKAGDKRDILRPFSSFLGKRIQDTPNRQVGEKFQEAVDRVRKSNEMVTLEYHLVIDQLQRLYEARLLPLPKGQIMVIIRNITDAKRAERALREMDRIKSEFISTAAHELRTPLSTIIGYLDLLISPGEFGGFGEDQKREFLMEIYEKGDALTRIIDDLLDISRIESGKGITLDLEECDPYSLITRVVESFKVFGSDHHFKVNLNLPSQIKILMDRQRIVQVFENLLSNAVKYSPHGGIIEIRGAPTGADFMVSVIDRGIGMNEEQKARVFDKFYRADSSNTAVSGLGIGMSIAKQIVEMHGGAIWVESAPGRGTVVHLTLPLNRPAVAKTS